MMRINYEQLDGILGPLTGTDSVVPESHAPPDPSAPPPADVTTALDPVLDDGIDAALGVSGPAGPPAPSGDLPDGYRLGNADYSGHDSEDYRPGNEAGFTTHEFEDYRPGNEAGYSSQDGEYRDGNAEGATMRDLSGLRPQPMIGDPGLGVEVSALPPVHGPLVPHPEDESDESSMESVNLVAGDVKADYQEQRDRSSVGSADETTYHIEPQSGADSHAGHHLQTVKEPVMASNDSRSFSFDQETGRVEYPDGSGYDFRTGASSTREAGGEPEHQPSGTKFDRETGVVSHPDGSGYDFRTGASSTGAAGAEPEYHPSGTKFDEETGVVSHPDGSGYDFRTGASSRPVHEEPSTEVGGAKYNPETGRWENPDGSSSAAPPWEEGDTSSWGRGSSSGASSSGGGASFDRQTGVVTYPDGSGHDFRTGASSRPVHEDPTTEVGGAKYNPDTGRYENPDGSSSDTPPWEEGDTSSWDDGSSGSGSSSSGSSSGSDSDDDQSDDADDSSSNSGSGSSETGDDSGDESDDESGDSSDSSDSSAGDDSSDDSTDDGDEGDADSLILDGFQPVGAAGSSPAAALRDWATDPDKRDMHRPWEPSEDAPPVRSVPDGVIQPGPDGDGSSPPPSLPTVDVGDEPAAPTYEWDPGDDDGGYLDHVVQPGPDDTGVTDGGIDYWLADDVRTDPLPPV